MKAVIQRVKEAQVQVDNQTVGQIRRGMVILLSVGKNDTPGDCDYLIQKLTQLRIFDDDEGKMNRASHEVGAEFLVVSQFTLHGDCSKGRRPSFDKAADPQKADVLYNYFVEQLRQENRKVKTGQFRAMMDVSLINDGPVTFILDSRS